MMDIHPIVNGYSADICRTVCVGRPTTEQQATYEPYLEAQQGTIARVKTVIGMVELDEVLHGIIRDGGQGDHLFGPTMHGVGIEFEEAPCRPATPFSMARRHRRRWRPMWSAPSGIVAFIPAPGGCVSRTPWW